MKKFMITYHYNDMAQKTSIVFVNASSYEEAQKMAAESDYGQASYFLVVPA